MSGVITFLVYEYLGTGTSYVAESRRIPRDEIRGIARDFDNHVAVHALGMPVYRVSLKSMTPEQIAQLDADLLDDLETDVKWSSEYKEPEDAEKRASEYLGKAVNGWRWNRTETR